MASTVRQEYEIDGATLMITWEADRPATEVELLLLARLAKVVEGSEAWRTAGRR